MKCLSVKLEMPKVLDILKFCCAARNYGVYTQKTTFNKNMMKHVIKKIFGS